MSDELALRVAHLTTLKEVEEVMAVLKAVEDHGRKSRELASKLKAEMIEWIKANGKPNKKGQRGIEYDGVRYYVGDKKVHTRAVPMAEFVDSLWRMCGDDTSKFVKCLAHARDTFRHGEVRELEARAFGDMPEKERPLSLFVTRKVDDLRTGKPVKVLKTIPIPKDVS
jgi:hypothetical protein